MFEAARLVSPTKRPFAGIVDRSCCAARGSPARCGGARSASAVIPAPTSRQLAERCRRVHAVPGPRPVSPIRQTRRVRRGRAGEGGLACRESLPSQPSVSSMGVDSLRARQRPFPHQSSTAGSCHPDEPRATAILFVRQIISGNRALSIAGRLQGDPARLQRPSIQRLRVGVAALTVIDQSRHYHHDCLSSAARLFLGANVLH